MDLQPRSRLAVIAPLAALAYPAVLWLGVRVSPIFVAASLAIPLLGLLAAACLDGERSPRGRAIAHLVVASPPLFALLGGWLDWQHAIPVSSLGVWVPLWTALAIGAALEHPRAFPAAPPRASRRLAIAHGVSAAVIVLFAVPHLLNHLGGLFGGDVHIAMMTALRRVYRHGEPLLFAAAMFQIATGLWLLRGQLARSAKVLQTTSGLYLLVFLLSHVSAALRARSRGVDTNWNWLDGGELLSDPWLVRLVPYYFLAVVALGLHAGCGLDRVLRGHGVAVRRGTVAAVVTGVATMTSALIMIALFRA